MDKEASTPPPMVFAAEAALGLYNVVKPLANLPKSPGPGPRQPYNNTKPPSLFFSTISKQLGHVLERISELRATGCRHGSPEEKEILGFLTVLEGLAQVSQAQYS